MDVDVIALLVVPADPVFDAVVTRGEVAACYRLAQQLLGAHGDNALLLLGIYVVYWWCPYLLHGNTGGFGKFTGGLAGCESDLDCLGCQCDGGSLGGFFGLGLAGLSLVVRLDEGETGSGDDNLVRTECSGSGHHLKNFLHCVFLANHG